MSAFAKFKDPSGLRDTKEAQAREMTKARQREELEDLPGHLINKKSLHTSHCEDLAPISSEM